MPPAAASAKAWREHEVDAQRPLRPPSQFQCFSDWLNDIIEAVMWVCSLKGNSCRPNARMPRLSTRRAVGMGTCKVDPCCQRLYKLLALI